MKMKNIFSLFLIVTLLSLSSCFKIDNWDEPDSTFFGTVYEVFEPKDGGEYIRRPILASQNDWQIRIWERTWTGHEGGATSSQDLRIKQDGTFQNTKLFAGEYDMLPDDGPFWPVLDTLRKVVLKKGKATEVNFEVEPYMVIDDFTIETGIMPLPFVRPVPPPEPAIWVKWKIRAPMLERHGVEIPNLHNTKVFLSLTKFCGQGDNSRINLPIYDDDGRITFNITTGAWSYIINNGWRQLRWKEHEPEQTDYYLGLSEAENRGDGVDTSPEFDRVIKVKPGYTYYIRVGACTTSRSQRYNYSPIKKIVVGQPDAKGICPVEVFDVFD